MKLLNIFFCGLLLITSSSLIFRTSAPNHVTLIKEINAPVLDGRVDDSAWLNATLLDLNFTFINGQNHRANVHLGHNGTHFFVGAIIFLVGPNPFSVAEEMVLPDGFLIYFDVQNDGKLSPPEDAKGLLNFVGVRHSQIYLSMSLSLDWFWDSAEDLPFLQNWGERRPSVSNSVLWTPDENIAASNISTCGMGYYSGGLTGDQHFEFCFPLSNNDKIADGLQVATGETRTMGVALEFFRQGYEPEDGVRIPDLYDFWPGDGFTPNVSTTPSEYARVLLNYEGQFGSLNFGILFIVVVIAVSIILWLITKHK